MICPPIFLLIFPLISMLFHNRPVRADMGSVIVMVECDGLVVKVWLVPNLQLYILALSGDELAALHLQWSEAKVKVVTVHISFSLVNQFDWFISAVLSSSLSH